MPTGGESELGHGSEIPKNGEVLGRNKIDIILWEKLTDMILTIESVNGSLTSIKILKRRGKET